METKMNGLVDTVGEGESEMNGESSIDIDTLPYVKWVSLLAQMVNNLPKMWETLVWSLGWQDPLEKGKATHFSILAWRSPWTIQSMGSQTVRHDWGTYTHSLTPLRVRCLRIQAVIFPWLGTQSQVGAGPVIDLILLTLSQLLQNLQNFPTAMLPTTSDRFLKRKKKKKTEARDIGGFSRIYLCRVYSIHHIQNLVWTEKILVLELSPILVTAAFAVKTNRPPKCSGLTQKKFLSLFCVTVQCKWSGIAVDGVGEGLSFMQSFKDSGWQSPGCLQALASKVPLDIAQQQKGNHEDAGWKFWSPGLEVVHIPPPTPHWN